MNEKKWRQFFQKEMDKEMQEIDGILEKLNEDPKMKDVVAPEDMYDNIMAKIREEEAKQERLSNEEQELIQLGKVYKKRRKLTKVLVLAAVMVGTLVAVGITSMGGPEKVMEKVSWFMGKKEQTNIDSDSNRVAEPDDVSEAEAYQMVEDEFGFYPVRLDYLPKDVGFQEIDADQVMQRILMMYQGTNDRVIAYTMYLNYRTGSSSIDIEDKLIQEYEKEINGISLKIAEYLVEEDQTYRYVITYEYHSIYYHLQLMNIEKEEIEKIITNLFFS